ncbi:MAG: TrbI/VirB10 family protein [Thiotrichaceae bacterium]|nr:TrbI/VirB10 family protein [Thiotrichaceae bacterium]
MPNEVEASHQETPATHKKNAQVYGLVIGGMITIALIAQALIQSNSVNEPVDVQRELNEPAVNTSKHNSFDEQFDMEQRRIQAEKNNESPVAVDELMVGIEKKKTDLQNSFSQFKPNAADKEKSAYEKWQEQEQMRVWDARRSALNVSLEDTTKPRNNYQREKSPYNHVFVNKNTEGLSKLDRERAMVNEKIRAVQNEIAQTQKSAGLPESFSNLYGKGFGQSNTIGQLANRFSSDPGGSKIIGQPESEQQPKPGELLLPTATVIRAALESKSISDYIGSFKAQIMDDVYDVSGEFILVPKGSKVDGQIVRISNVNEPIQNRMGMLLRWIILPNGKRVSLKKASALDLEGVGALRGDVNYHFLAQFLGVAAYALVANNGSRSGTSYTQETTYRGEVTQGFKDQLAPLAQGYLSLVPTVTIHRGTPLSIYIEDDIYIKPWSKVVSGLLSAY